MGGQCRVPGGRQITHLALFAGSLWPRRLPVAVALLMWVLWAALIILAASHDNVLRIPGPGRGLLEHYGFVTCFVTGPLVLLNTYLAVAYFLRLLRDIDQFVVVGADKEAISAITAPHMDSILLRGKWRYMLPLICFFGVGLSVVIFGRLDRPELYWGNDVFNAEAYPSSWLAANSYLLFLWGFVYPLGIFYVFHIAISAQIVVASLMRQKLLRLDFLHVDRCGGMARFGKLNLLIMQIYVWMALAFWPLHRTHQNDYSSLIFGEIALSVLLILHSTYGISWVARAIKAQRNEAVTALNERIRDMMERKHRNFSAAVAAMEYRDRILGVASFPYAGGVLVAVNFLRFAPAAVAIMRLTAQGWKFV